LGSSILRFLSDVGRGGGQFVAEKGGQTEIVFCGIWEIKEIWEK